MSTTDGGRAVGGASRASTWHAIAQSISGAIAALSGLTAIAWLGLPAVPGGPDTTARYVLLGIGIALALLVTALWALRTWNSLRAGVAFLAIADLSVLSAALSAPDGRVGLTVASTLSLVGLFAAFSPLRNVVIAQCTAGAVLVCTVLVVGLTVGHEPFLTLAPFLVSSVFGSVALPLILHLGFMQLTSRRSVQSTEPVRDSLTEVLTRHGLYAAATTGLSTLNRKEFLVVVRVHLDQFHDISVGDGRERGEQVLRRIASRLANGVRGGDLVARTGDAEFSALAGVTHEGVQIFANRFRELVFDVEDPVPVSASVGVAFRPTPLTAAQVQVEIDALLHRAEVAMLSAQEAGGDRVEIDWSTPQDDPVQRSDAAAS
ncbi:diguanylate cyclase [Williamsia sp. CHRR-6]|uniref:GGDEF domain-containing protein n=1 Tax=Williamsia sp. CHRR-6 TaxID=2835871 RepID=UPI001BD99A6D|nr:GGDEF domain-containing protein [Williamsia sp. CHRR-6]MBT0567783.1 GGDEF domain-containing protein [Williamsia sp. CHRR-6]